MQFKEEKKQTKLEKMVKNRISDLILFRLIQFGTQNFFVNFTSIS